MSTKLRSGPRHWLSWETGWRVDDRQVDWVLEGVQFIAEAPKDVRMTGAVSPMARAMPRITAVTMPGAGVAAPPAVDPHSGPERQRGLPQADDTGGASPRVRVWWAASGWPAQRAGEPEKPHPSCRMRME